MQPAACRRLHQVERRRAFAASRASPPTTKQLDASDYEQAAKTAATSQRSLRGALVVRTSERPRAERRGSQRAAAKSLRLPPSPPLVDRRLARLLSDGGRGGELRKAAQKLFIGRRWRRRWRALAASRVKMCVLKGANERASERRGARACAHS